MDDSGVGVVTLGVAVGPLGPVVTNAGGESNAVSGRAVESAKDTPTAEPSKPKSSQLATLHRMTSPP